MSDKYRIPDYKKIYPEASDEVIAVLRHTERKMQYQEYDLKTGDYEINQKEETVTYFSSREDSLERLLETERQFSYEQPSVEAEVIQVIMYEKLHKALQMLREEERELIVKIYFEEKTEREIADAEGVYRNAIHKRKQRILEKLKKFLKNLEI